MALVNTAVETVNEQERFYVRYTVAFDNSYPTGGETLDWEALAGTPQSSVLLALLPEGDGTYHAVYDRTNKKIMMIVSATGAEVANAFDLSGLTAWPVTFLVK